MKKKIGFIAMSGVRVQNQELLAIGLTLPGFVERSEVIGADAGFGLPESAKARLLLHPGPRRRRARCLRQRPGVCARIVNFQPQHMSVSELETRFRGLAKALY